VQDFLRLVAGLDYAGGSPRVKEIVHRIVSDLYKTIEDLNITPDEFWAGIAYLNRLSTAHEAGLVSPGLGFDAYLDMRREADEDALGVKDGTLGTIVGPLYVVGGVVEQVFAGMDDGTEEGDDLVVQGIVYGEEGEVLPGEQMELFHGHTQGFLSLLDLPGV